MADLISIIVPVYQSEKYLNQCIESILKQTYGNLELMLVDDGSTDHSLAICREYADRDARVKVIHQENHGVSAARNAGLRQASGDYLMLIDGDDYIHPYMVAELLAAVHLQRADMVICGFQMVYEDETPTEKHSIETPFAGTLEEFLNEQLIPLYDRLLIHTQSNKMYSARLQRKYQLFYQEDMAINEDVCISVKMLRHCRRVACIKGDFLNYRQYSRPQSLVTRFNDNGVETCFALLKVIRSCLKAGHASPSTVNQINNRMIFHICGFAGLSYYRSDWSLHRCYKEIKNLAVRPEFQKLLRETMPEGTKNKTAAFVLSRRWCWIYHMMCVTFYRKQRNQRKQDKRKTHE
ncbi:MAG: glycosyltransferase family 2 protein [Hungatella sp.]